MVSSIINCRLWKASNYTQVLVFQLFFVQPTATSFQKHQLGFSHALWILQYFWLSEYFSHKNKIPRSTSQEVVPTSAQHFTVINSYSSAFSNFCRVGSIFLTLHIKIARATLFHWAIEQPLLIKCMGWWRQLMAYSVNLHVSLKFKLRTEQC